MQTSVRWGVLWLAALPAVGFGQHVQTEVVAVTGQAIPDGTGVFSSFGMPALNDDGHVAFTAELTGTAGGDADNAGVYASGIDGVFRVARRGQSVADGTLRRLDHPAINNSGQVAF